MPVKIADNISKLLLEHKKPINVVTLGIDYDQSLKASLEFDYSGLRVPYSKSNDKSPYLSVKSTEEDLVYWIKRDYQHEQMAYNMLLACKFVPMQTNNLALEKENAIDLLRFLVKGARIISLTGEQGCRKNNNAYGNDRKYIRNNEPSYYRNCI